jgi:hypothetical protein
MNDWLNELPFAWLLIAVLALSYIAATAVYTRVMMLVIDRRRRTPAKIVRSDTTIVDRSSSPGIAVAVTANSPRSASTEDPSASSAGSATSASADNSGGAQTGWDRLTLEDIEGVKRALATRRAEALARHAEELRKLNAEQAEIDAIELAINSFAKRYGRGTPKGTS